MNFISILHFLVFTLWAALFDYILFALYCVMKYKHSSPPLKANPSVTMLIPLLDLGPEIYKNLSSFCQQDYSDYEIIFGVSNPQNPTLGVAQKLIKEFPDRDIALVIDEFLFDPNAKTGNLINLYCAAKHDLIVFANSDLRVKNDYLGRVVAEFADPLVGVVTCMYRGIAAKGLASRLSAMFINEWILPSIPILTSRDMGIR